ncbi:MAG: serine/threonine-protein kinase [Actinomycetaceae bacterium]|nr:serine/threonine-protein kinase [Actinomycetaceae bacterium]
MYGYSQAQRGDELGGYRLIRPLGHGGSGVVWEVEDEGRNCFALKLLHPAIAADPVNRQRLAREASTLNRIRSDGVAQVVDLETEGDVPFVVTELIDGLSLRDDLKENGAFPFADARYIFLSLCDTLKAVHDRGVIHRDLKPSNIVLGPLGPVIIDFGIAQAEDDDRLTSTGLVSGTAGWVAPEVLGGKAPDKASDWWSLTAIFLTMLTSRQPFGTGGAEAVLGRVLINQPDTEGIHPELARLIRQALGPVDQRLDFEEFVERVRLLDADEIDEWSEDGTTLLEAADAVEALAEPASVEQETVHLRNDGEATIERRSVFDRDDSTVVQPVISADDVAASEINVDMTATYPVERPSWTPVPESSDAGYVSPPALVAEPYRYAKPPPAVLLTLGIASALALLPLHGGTIGAAVLLAVILVVETTGYARVWRERRRIASGLVRPSDNALAVMNGIAYVFKAAVALVLNTAIALLIVIAAWILWGMNNGVYDWTKNLYFTMLTLAPGQQIEALGASQFAIAIALWASNLFIILVARVGPGGWHLQEGAFSIAATLIPHPVARPLIGVVVLILVSFSFFFSFIA